MTFETAVDCQWSEWSPAECSVTCGNGTKTKFRKKRVEEQNGGNCTGSSNETEACNLQGCPGWL